MTERRQFNRIRREHRAYPSNRRVIWSTGPTVLTFKGRVLDESAHGMGVELHSGASPNNGSVIHLREVGGDLWKILHVTRVDKPRAGFVRLGCTLVGTD